MAERIINPINNIFKQYRKVNLVNPYWYAKSFVSTWRTSLTSAGSSTATQVKLPLVSTGVYNFIVDWGDGNSNQITIWNQAQTTHTYSIAGDYVIKINGVCTGWQFNNTGDKLKILSVASWGKLKLGVNAAHFNGCANLNLSAVSDILDLTGITSLSQSFASTGISVVNKISEWDVSNITNMSGTFLNCGSFNSNIGLWNVSNVTDFSSLFQGATAFNNGGSNTINNWTTSSAVNMSFVFNGCTNFNQPLGNWNTTNVTNMSSMFLSAVAFNQNIGTWNVGKVLNFVAMFSVATAFNNAGSNTINNWALSSTGSINMNQMFRAATGFNQPIGNWNTGRVIDFSQMFQSASIFNQNIGAWNVSLSTTFASMFLSASSFNNGGSTDINNWILISTGSVLMNAMFQNAFVFNQPIGNWNTVAVINMSTMFQSAVAFNQNIGTWNVSNVTTFLSMFQSATAFNNGGSNTINNWTLKTTGTVTTQSMFQSATVFNQPIGSWNTIAVINMGRMFQSASAFNQSLNLWNTSNNTSFAFMFQQANVFNQNIGSWNVTNATSMTSMFQNASAFNNGGSNTINNWVLNTTTTLDTSSMFQSATLFNQPLGLWNVSKVINMSGMFSFTSFNQDISTWNTTLVTNMSSMFTSNNAFNQNIGAWNVSSVTNMSAMFSSSLSFNQNIGSWNISNVVNFTNFMLGKAPATFSTTNLDAIYNGWSALVGGVKPSISITFGTAKYTAASSAGRAILTSAPNLWTIVDGGI